MKDRKEIKWLKKPEEHDYPAAASYLSLMYNEGDTKKLVGKLRVAKVSFYKAKDMFRSSGLSLLGVSNLHVKKDRKKIKKGVALSPLLLVRDSVNGKTIIADGYHRLCAVYSFNEDALIPCKIV
ncbi:MAG TPA: hypothetical protein VII99_03090 [Bacteroidia bacterium]